MSDSEFSLRTVEQAFNLTTIEGNGFFPEIEPITSSVTLSGFLEESLPLAIATGSEKARSELIISPVLVEVRKILERKISLFSGEDFTVDEVRAVREARVHCTIRELATGSNCDPASGLSGVCDFLIS